jgi:hypothetical protein
LHKTRDDILDHPEFILTVFYYFKPKTKTTVIIERV